MKIRLLYFIAILFAPAILNAQVTEDAKYTPKAFLNANILEYKFGGEFDGFVVGLDPVINLNSRLKLHGWFDMALLDGKYNLRDVMDNDNKIKKYRKAGFGIMLKLFEFHGSKNIKFILSMHDEGNYRVTRYVDQEMPYRQQIALRTGIENFRFIAEPNKRNATMIDNGVSEIEYLVTPQRQIIWYEGISNWHMNCFYAGLSSNQIFSAKVENSYGSGTMARFMSIYADVLLPLSVNVEDVMLNGVKYKVTDAYKKNSLGARFGVSTTGFLYSKIEAGVLPGLKGGWFFNSAIGYTFKVGKRE